MPTGPTDAQREALATLVEVGGSLPASALGQISVARALDRRGLAVLDVAGVVTITEAGYEAHRRWPPVQLSDEGRRLATLPWVDWRKERARWAEVDGVSEPTPRQIPTWAQWKNPRAGVEPTARDREELGRLYAEEDPERSAAVREVRQAQRRRAARARRIAHDQGGT